jgi:dTDP-4-dehydrorhamnose reductase
MKIIVFGSTGMLGTYCVKFFKQKGYTVLPVDREMLDLTSSHENILNFLISNVSSVDVIINAAGVIKQRNTDIGDMYKVNTIFPHILSKFKMENGCNIIHITTDCVFSGKDGYYNESSLPDCEDDYGKSKLLGEAPNLSIIRTSIIGEEINNKLSLLEWCKSKREQTVDGYVDHYWNGVTCLELCKRINYLLEYEAFWEGVSILHSPEIVSKYNLINMISNVFDLKMLITPKIGGKCYRNLQNVRCIPTASLKQQLEELKEFNIYE